MKAFSLALATTTVLALAVPTLLAHRWVRLRQAFDRTPFNWDGVLYAFPAWNAVCVLVIAWLTFRLARRRIWAGWALMADSVLLQTWFFAPLVRSPRLATGHGNLGEVLPAFFFIPGLYLIIASAALGFLWLMATPKSTAVA